MSIEESVGDWELLAQVCQAYRKLSDVLMEQIEMHRGQATLLCRLFIEDGMTQSELAEQLSVQGATISNMLQRMEEADLVTRHRDPEDNRLVRVYLTEEGRTRERSITKQFATVEAQVFAGINPAKREILREVLRRMLDNMNEKP